MVSQLRQACDDDDDMSIYMHKRTTGGLAPTEIWHWKWKWNWLVVDRTWQGERYPEIGGILQELHVSDRMRYDGVGGWMVGRWGQRLLRTSISWSDLLGPRPSGEDPVTRAWPRNHPALLVF